MIAFCDKNREKEMAETQINKVIFKWSLISYEDLVLKLSKIHLKRNIFISYISELCVLGKVDPQGKCYW